MFEALEKRRNNDTSAADLVKRGDSEIKLGETRRREEATKTENLGGNNER